MTGATLKNWIALLCAMFLLIGFQIGSSSANPANPAHPANPEPTGAASSNDVQDEVTLNWHHGVLTRSIYVDKVTKQTLIEINKIPYVLSQKLTIREQGVVDTVRYDRDTNAGALVPGRKVVFESAGVQSHAVISRIVIDLVRKGD